MARSILVGLDGSAVSASATELGIRWAKQSNALLVGLGIIDEPEILQPISVPPGATAYEQRRNRALMAEARRKVESYLEQFALRCAEAGVSSKVLEDVGLPADQILLEAQRYDLVMLGQQTYFAFETQAEADRTLYQVLRHSPRPVVAVPERPAEGAAVVVAYDGRVGAARALQAFQAVLSRAGQEVHVVSVFPEHLQAARCGSRAVDFLDFHQIQARLHAIGSTEPAAEVILKQARERGAGLIVMGAYGQPGWKELLFGSVTRTVLRDSRVPLFLYQ